MLNAPAPILFIWTGENFWPLGDKMRKLCDEHYVVGGKYRLVEHLDRSPKSHNHYFAALSTAWSNLPEFIAERFPTPEHLRKYALIKCGFYDSRSIVATNKTAARELARFIQPMDEFSIVTTQEAVVSDETTGKEKIECTVTIYTAKSQSTKAMSRADFAKAKQAVLDFVADIIGASQNQLTQNTKEIS